MEIFDENGNLKPAKEVEQIKFYEALQRNPDIVDRIAESSSLYQTKEEKQGELK